MLDDLEARARAHFDAHLSRALELAGAPKEPEPVSEVIAAAMLIGAVLSDARAEAAQLGSLERTAVARTRHAETAQACNANLCARAAASLRREPA